MGAEAASLLHTSKTSRARREFSALRLGRRSRRRRSGVGRNKRGRRSSARLFPNDESPDAESGLFGSQRRSVVDSRAIQPLTPRMHLDFDRLRELTEKIFHMNARFSVDIRWISRVISPTRMPTPRRVDMRVASAKLDQSRTFTRTEEQYPGPGRTPGASPKAQAYYFHSQPLKCAGRIPTSRPVGWIVQRTTIQAGRAGFTRMLPSSWRSRWINW